MLNLLRSNQLFVVLVVIVYALLLHFPVFLGDTVYSVQSNGLLSAVVGEWLAGKVILSKILYLVLIVGQALAINQFANGFKISTPYTYFPAGFYVLLTGLLNPGAILSSALMANTFLIVAVFELYDTYKKNHANGNIFNVGFWISMAGLFHFSSAVFLLFGIFGVISLRQVRFNELLIAVLGYLVPFFLAFTVYFWRDQIPYFGEKQFESLSFIDFSSLEFYKNVGRLAVIGVLMILSFLSFQAYLSKKTIQIQKYVNLVFLIQIVAICSLLIQEKLCVEDGMLILFPLSVFMSLTFLGVKRKAFAEVFFLTLFLLTIWFNYSDFLT